MIRRRKHPKSTGCYYLARRTWNTTRLQWQTNKTQQQHINCVVLCHWNLRLLVQIDIYYIHTEKNSPKSDVANFHTQMGSSQSEERTMVFTLEKNATTNKNRERRFFTCEKNDTSIRSHSDVWVSRQNSHLLKALAACSAVFADIQRESFFSKCFS